jgi:hypothetical protein
MNLEPLSEREKKIERAKNVPTSTSVNIYCRLVGTPTFKHRSADATHRRLDSRRSLLAMSDLAVTAVVGSWPKIVD